MNRRLPPALAALLLPLLVFALGLALTVVAARTLQRIEADQAHADFSRTVQRVADEVSRRFGQPVYGLNGLRGLFTATPQVTRAAFSSFVLSREERALKYFTGLKPAARDALPAISSAFSSNDCLLISV